MNSKVTRLREDPVAFASTVLGFTPFPYQERLLRESSKRVVAICGRQIGKSTCSAAKLIHFAATHPGTTSIIVSATLRQSMETFDKCLGFVDGSVLKASVVRATRTLIRFNNQARVLCLPSGRYGSTLRGLTVHFAVLDEAAFIPEEVITQAVFPMLLTTDGTLWMLTSPWDKDHITYRCFTDPRWAVYHLPSSVNPLVTQGFMEEQRRLVGEERFAMEYLGQFVDDTKAYFPMTLLRPCLPQETPDSPYALELKQRMELYAGYDPGGKESQAALVVIERAGDHLNVRLLKAEQGKSYTQFTVEVADLHKAAPLVRLAVDATGLGEPVVEHARELSLPAEGVRMTAPVREELLSNMHILLEQHRVTLLDDSRLLNSLNSIEYERTRTGGYTFSHRKGTYDDLAYALALACWAARGKQRPEPIILGINQ